VTQKTEEWREGLERWIEQRIRTALESCPLPFEKEVARLRLRIEEIRTRCQDLSCRIEKSAHSCEEAGCQQAAGDSKD